MANYTSFGQVAAGWRKKHDVAKARRIFLEGAGTLVQRHIQKMHGSSSLKANSALTVAMKGGSKPLRDSGGLSNAVYFLVRFDETIISTHNQFLANIHEYGRRWKMSDKQRRFIMAKLAEAGIAPRGRGKGGYITIPARPIWRKALQLTRNDVVKLMKKVFEQHLTN